MSLTIYLKKRNFLKSPEPKGTKPKTTPGLSFVVQRHKALHLHYDFRLELKGVLKSWAVPKGPSLNPMDKRLAIMVEDHPYDYKDFEGVIPEGNYGAGIIEVWDTGLYTPLQENGDEATEDQMEEAIKDGKVRFRLNGNKTKGEFVLVKIHNDNDKPWFLIKQHDEFAVDRAYDIEKNTDKESLINQWLAKNKRTRKKKKAVSKVL
jgi:bifunctional non-homologous end joining protein LigD